MKTSVVVTALNHGSTIIESIESTLSQTRLPDQLGLALGSSLDVTDGMAEFYEEEFDFVHRDGEVSTSDRGLAQLRLDSLQHVEGDRVLFLRANSYLRRDAVRRIDELGTRDSAVLGAATFIDRDGDRRTHSAPEEVTPRSIVEAGPVPPGTVVWPRKFLESVLPDLRRLRLGSFTTMGWLMALADRGMEASRLEAPIVETWDSRVGPACWTRSATGALKRFRERLKGNESVRERLSASLKQAENGPLPVNEGLAGDPEVYDWVLEGFPLTE